MRTTRFLIFTLLALTLPARLLAWGPHSEITQAAMDTLPPDDPLVRELGDAFGKLHDYCWMADWRRQLHREAGAWFYVDDYLLFPSMITHRDHLCPEVKQTYDPFFRRALQALRTESPVNAARWIGAILHWREGSSGQVVLRLLGAQTYGTLPSDSNPLQRGDAELLFSATKETAYAQILVYGDGLPGSVAETIALTPAP